MTGMKKINRKFFFDQVKTRLFSGKLSQSQVDGLGGLLDFWEAGYINQDDRWLAYALATAYHETDQKIQPIEEYGKGKGRVYGKPDVITNQIYYGRGFVQLTWKSNYEKMSRIFGVDFVNNPAKVMEAVYAAAILFYGMKEGSFTGRKFSDYFSKRAEDWVSARRIINGTDRANLIASYAKRFYSAISYTTGDC